MSIQITTQDDMQDFLFVSYKSQNRAQVEEIISRLQKDYGLRVYYDKKFETENSSWLKLMPEQLQSRYCKGMLVFGSPQYICSYACLYELIYFRTFETADIHERVKPIIPISLDTAHTPIQKMLEDPNLLDPVSMLASEADALRKAIDSICEDYDHLHTDATLTGKIDELITFLKSIQHRLDNTKRPTNTNEIKPAFIAKQIRRFFEIQEENTNFYDDNLNFYKSLYETIVNPNVCGKSVFRAPSVVSVPAVTPASLSTQPVATQPVAFRPIEDISVSPDKDARSNDHGNTPEDVGKPSPHKKPHTTTGDITFSIYSQEYTENQSNMMLIVFREVLRRHQDAADDLMSQLTCASNVDYEDDKNRSDSMPTYFRGCQTFRLSEAGKQICIGTSYSYSDKLKLIAKLFAITGEDPAVLSGVELPDVRLRAPGSTGASQDASAAAKPSGRGDMLSYHVYHFDGSGNQSDLMYDVYSEVLKRHPDKLDEAAERLTSLSLTDYASPENRGAGMPPYFKTCRTFAVGSRTCCVGFGFGLKDKLIQIVKLLDLCGESSDVLQIDGMELPPMPGRPGRRGGKSGSGPMEL